MSRFALAALALCGVLAACAGTGSTDRLTGAVVPTGAPDAAPASFTETCERAPELCGASAETAGMTAATPAPNTPSEVGEAAAGAPAARFDDAQALRLLQRVNSEVNGLMARDMSLLVNLADDWTPARRTPYGLVGDCKSFAAAKRSRLLAAGFPAERLFYVVVFRRDIGLHALLMAHLDRGDFALDNRQAWVVPWRDAPYVYVLRQAAGDPLRWSNLVATSPTAEPPAQSPTVQSLAAASPAVTLTPVALAPVALAPVSLPAIALGFGPEDDMAPILLSNGLDTHAGSR